MAIRKKYILGKVLRNLRGCETHCGEYQLLRFIDP